MNNNSEFLKLAREKFSKLTKAEILLLKQIQKKGGMNYSSTEQKENDPECAKSWEEDRILHANFIQWICTDEKSIKLLPSRGLWIVGARIDGDLDFQYITIPFLLFFLRCSFNDLKLMQSEIKGLYLTGSHTGSIYGDRLKVHGSICLNHGFKSRGEIRFAGSNIGHQLACMGAEFINPEGYALIADSAKITQGAFFCRYPDIENPSLVHDFKSEGEIRLVGAEIGQNLECDGGIFINNTKEGKSINAGGLKINGHAFLRNDFKSIGEVDLSDAKIEGTLDCRKGEFIGSKKALNANRIKVGGGVFLRHGFKAKGEVNFVGSNIDRNFDCENGNINNMDGDAIVADGITVNGAVFLREGFNSEGGIRFPRSKIKSDLDCSGTSKDVVILNSNKITLNIEGSYIGGSVFLRGKFKSVGKLSLPGVRIRGNLDCGSSIFEFGKKEKNKKQLDNTVLDIEGSKIDGNVCLNDGFKSLGRISMLGTSIGMQLKCKGGNFINQNSMTLNMEQLKIDGNVCFENFHAEGIVDLVDSSIKRSFIWKGLKSSSDLVTLDLRSANVGILCDEFASWPKRGKIHLDRFIYNGIDDESPRDVKSRIEWLHRQPADNFSLQPYEQLATVYKNSGHDEESRLVQIQKNKDIAKSISVSSFGRWLWYRYIGRCIGYGYKPMIAIIYSIFIILLGTFIFQWGYQSGVIVPEKVDLNYSNDNLTFRTTVNYPQFNPLFYSLDTFIPLVNLHQSEYYLPNGKKGWLNHYIIVKISNGCLINIYMILHILVGWILMTLLVGGLIGIIRT